MWLKLFFVFSLYEVVDGCSMVSGISGRRAIPPWATPATLDNDSKILITSACSDANYTSSGRILHGKDGSMDDYPFFGLIAPKLQIYFGQKEGGGIQVRCGGAFITQRHFLTAYHCFDKVQHLEWVILTRIKNRCEAKHGRMFTVDKLFIRPESTIENGIISDIAIARVTEDMPDIIKLPSSDIRQGLTATVIGFGLTKFAKEQSERHPYRPCTIQKLDRYVPDQGKCVDPTKKPIGGAFCARGTGNQLSAICKGDSGGPMFTEEGGSRVIIGIASFGDESCNTKNGDDYYTNVYQFMPWIVSSVNEK